MPPKDFSCKQCGNCCLNLPVTTALEEDLLLWEGEGREDILEWVALIPIANNVFAYDIWLHPKTGSDVERCPWLRRLPGKNKYVCRIHKVKPTVCKEYPKSKKHAKKTGCKGFEK
ncbi:MAG: YkgJ family cysteine cluster protein [Nitrospirae bacterium]|nr:YkgJ family cysteine cluster protein [Nitrospirota bacterium]